MSKLRRKLNKIQEKIQQNNGNIWEFSDQKSLDGCVARTASGKSIHSRLGTLKLLNDLLSANVPESSRPSCSPKPAHAIEP